MSLTRTPAEQHLLAALPEGEAAVLRAFFEENDARLVTEGDNAGSGRDSATSYDGRTKPQTVEPPSATSQPSLFQMRKADRP